MDIINELISKCYRPGRVNDSFCENCHRNSVLVGNDDIGYAYVCEHCKVFTLRIRKITFVCNEYKCIRKPGEPRTPAFVRDYCFNCPYFKIIVT